MSRIVDSKFPAGSVTTLTLTKKGRRQWRGLLCAVNPLSYAYELRM